MFLSRRQFVRRAVAAPAVLSFGVMTPRFLLRAAEQPETRRQDRVLVVIQLSGGNDGLNTVVPYADDDYRRSRPTLAIPARNVLKVNDEWGLHPALRGFAALLEANQLAIVQGVGYPDPNRSHFESMDIWHTCRRKFESRSDGWLGQCLEQLQRTRPQDVPALHLGREQQPVALASRALRVPSVKSLEEFRLNVAAGDEAAAVRDLASRERDQPSGLLDFVQSSTSVAVNVSERLQETARSTTATGDYPQTDLGQKLQTIARLIDSGLDTRVYYMAVDGFDTHSQQSAAHAGLLKQVGDAVAAFTKDVGEQGHAERLLTVCFSEFGRRVAENASEGTDHGTAAPMFLAGSHVQAGFIGPHPSLSDLDAGDLRFHTDFRQVYAAILEDWLGCASEPILGGEFRPVSIIAG
ncbi:MAG: DUF1501 domain-containing protein [Planctomycetaceae bacterium]